MESFEEDCTFCRIGTDKAAELAEYDRPIIEDEDFFVIPALGQLTAGYVLICSREHHLNLGLINGARSASFERLKERIRQGLVEEYGQNPIFFEHGPASFNMRAGSCVEHAHLHAIPVEMVTPPTHVTSHLDGGRISSVSEVAECAKAKRPYFFFECSDRTMYLYQVPLLPCQYGRQVLACELGNPAEWDWRTHPSYDMAIETGNRLRVRLEGQDNAHQSVLCATG
jgi:diadenosine tetraphosphate (Ap4A) HIT family hydrolase